MNISLPVSVTNPDGQSGGGASFTFTTSAKAVIQPSDLQLLGAFQLGYLYTAGIGARTVNGQARLFAGTFGTEFVVPPLKMPTATGSSFYNTATTTVRNWGNPLGSFQVNKAGAPWGGDTGIFFDADASRLWKTYGADYPQGEAQSDLIQGDPYYGYGNLNDAAGTLTPVGTWRTTATNPPVWNSSPYFPRYKGLYGGLYSIPQAWRQAFGGYRLALWGGGYGSLVCNPDLDGSAGPAAVAFDADGTYPQSSQRTCRVLYGSFNGYCNGNVKRAPIPPLSVPRQNHFEQVGPSVFSYTDLSFGQLMIDTPTKQGLLSFELGFTGYGQYLASNLRHEVSDYWLRVYDLNDVVKVSAGQVSPDSLTPTSLQRLTYPDLNYSVRAMGPGPGQPITSCTSVAGGQLVTVACANHGFQGTQGILHAGFDQPQYNGGFVIQQVPDANHYTAQGFLVPPQNGPKTFDGTPGTGPATAKKLFSNEPNAMPDGLDSQRSMVAYDPVANRIYVAIPVPFTVSDPNSWRIVVYVYQVAP